VHRLHEELGMPARCMLRLGLVLTRLPVSRRRLLALEVFECQLPFNSLIIEISVPYLACPELSEPSRLELA
jgi:hypothetical protein